MTAAMDAPSCLGVEQAVLGSILLTGSTYSRVADILDPDDFGEDLHRRIFDIAGQLARDGRAPTIVLVRPHLGDHDVGGASMGQYLAQLCSAAATPMGIDQLAQTIREFADLRRLMELAQGTARTAAAAGPGVKASRLAADMISEADRIALRDVPNSLRRTTLGEAGRAAYVEAAERRAGKPSRGVPTQIPELDDMIGSLERGEGSILAGRPSMGKSAVAVQIGVNVARSGAAVYMVSLEMGAMPLAQRVLSMVTAENGLPVPYSRMAKGHVSQRDEEAIEDASRRIDRLPFVIEQQPGLTVSQIMAKARQVKQQFAAQGIALGLVIVDHVSLVRASSRYAGNRVLEIGETSASLHAMARELDVHCMMLSQLNRKVEERADKRPQLSDLRESGDLEQNADLVLGAFREAYYLERSGNVDDAVRLLDVEHVMEIGVIKNRQGPTGVARLYVDMACNVVRSESPDQSRRTASQHGGPRLVQANYGLGGDS